MNKSIIVVVLICAQVCLNEGYSQNDVTDTSTSSLNHRVILDAGLGMGIYNAHLEDNALFNPTPFAAISLGYRLNELMYISAGVFGTGEKKVRFTRNSQTVNYTGTTMTFPVFVNFVSDKPGITSVFALGGYYQTDRFIRNNYTIVSGDQLQTGNFISNFGSALKFGLAYNNYEVPGFLPFKGTKFEVTYNGFVDLSDSNFKLQQSFVVFGISMFF